MDWPGPLRKAILNPLSPESIARQAIGFTVTSMSFGFGNTTSNWPVANLALFLPFKLRAPFPISHFAIPISASALGTGNMDMGIYSRGGTRIISTGSTAVAVGATAVQKIAASIELTPGSYYMAMASDTTGLTKAFLMLAGFSSTLARMTGLVEQLSAFPLPATMTPAAYTRTVFPMMGFGFPPGGVL